MAKDKKSFLLYCDLIHTVKKLSDEQAGKLLKHILSYVNDENPVANDVIIDLVFEPIKQQLKRDLKKYEGTCETNKENILKRWNKINTTVYEPIRPNTNDTDIEKDKDIDIGIDIEKEKLGSEFEKFWNIYNKKVGDKEKLLAKWSKIKDEDKTKIFETLPRYVASTEKQFRKNPETYLNNHSWNDEIIVKNSDSFEKINEKGQRYYDNGIIIPKDAPQRPSARHYWNAELNKWGIS